MGNKEKKNKHLLLGGVGEGRGRTDPGHPGHNALPSCPTTRPGPRPNSSRTTKSGGANGARLPGTVRLSASGVGALGPTGEHAELGSAGGDPPEPRRARGSPPRGPGQGRTRAFTWAPRRRAVASRVLPAASGPRRPLSPAARAADRAGRTAGAPEPPRCGGPRSRAAGSRHAFPPPGGRPRSRAQRGKSLPRTAGPTDGRRAGARTGTATRAAPLPQRRRRAGPCCCCQLVGRTLSMRARGPHPGNFRVWPFSPRSAPFSRLPPPPAQIREGPSAQAPAGSSGLRAAPALAVCAKQSGGGGGESQFRGDSLKSAQAARDSSGCALSRAAGSGWEFEDLGGHGRTNYRCLCSSFEGVGGGERLSLPTDLESSSTW